ISVASALFGECRTEDNAEFAELCDRIVGTPEWSVAVAAVAPSFVFDHLGWETVTAFLHIMLGGCKEERPVPKAPTPVGVQRFAVAASPGEGLCHEDVLDTGCRPDIPPCVGRTLLHRRSLAARPEAARNFALGPPDSHRLCGSRRHTSPLHQGRGGP